jgi:NAD+ diphosphatase
MSFVITADSPASAFATWFIWDHDQLLYLNGQLPHSGEHLNLTSKRTIGSINGTPCFSADLVGSAPAGAEWRGMRQSLLDMDRPHQQALSRARQLSLFDRGHRFCGTCAGPLLDNGHDIGKRCPSCGAVYYPKISPAMMVAIVRGHELLLARAPHFAEGMYSALAGFVEAGETLEQCVHREVKEEVGVTIGNLRYAGSQQWPFPHSLMLAFIADYEEGEIVPQAGEIADARWFHIDRLPILPSRASIAWWLIQHSVAMLKSSAL